MNNASNGIAKHKQLKEECIELTTRRKATVFKNKRITVNATTQANRDIENEETKRTSFTNEKHEPQQQKQSSHSYSNNSVTTQAMIYNDRVDRQRFKIHINDASQFNNEQEIRNSVGAALFSFLPH